MSLPEAPFGLSPFGFRAKRLNDIKTDLDNQMTAEFGEVNVTPQSTMGQIIGVIAKVLADIWENLEQVYFSQYPNSADGVALDNVVQFNGITRREASPTQVTGIANGLEGTLIPAGSLARLINSTELFVSTLPVIISASNASLATLEVTDLLPQVYTVLVNSEPYRYALPHVVFSVPFTAGDVADIIINNIVIGSVTFATTSNDMLDQIAAIIAGDTSVDTATSIHPDIINIVPNVGFYAAVTGIETTGGSAPTITTTFLTPGSIGAICTNLAAVINNGSGTVDASAADPLILLSANPSSVAFSVGVGLGIQVNDRSSPVPFEAQNNGPIAAPIGTLTQIVTPVGGWNSLTNLEEGVLGRFLETDAELRLRRLLSLRLLGRGTVEAIRAQLLAAGATSALVFENITMVQDPSSFTLSTDLVSGDSITIELDGLTQTPIPYTTSHANTMLLLSLQIEAFPGVESAVVGGVGNRTITMTFISGYQVIIDSVSISPSVVGVIIRNGRPPKSFEAVVQGQTNAVIGQTIWLSKPAGIQTFGSTMQPVIDSQGITHAIFFSRPTEIFIWVNVTLTLYTEETFPSNGLELVQQAIFTYINTLGIGVDVLTQRVNSQIFTVPGIASGVLTMAATSSTSESPSYSSANIPIGENEIAVTELNLIAVTI